MRLTVLGTAAPYPRPGEPCSGYLVEGSGSGAVWVDAGSGSLAELQRHRPPADLDAIWISHRHADHASDLLVAYYALRFAERRPVRPIPLIAPEGMLDRMAAFLGPSSVDELPAVFDFRPMSGWGEASFGSLRLSWGPVQHGVPAFGLTVDEGDIRLAYSGDAAPCRSLDDIGENATAFLVEAGYDRAPESDAVHHTPEDAGRTAMSAGASRLILTHLDEGVPAADAMARAAGRFTGPVSVARCGDVFVL